MENEHNKEKDTKAPWMLIKVPAWLGPLYSDTMLVGVHRTETAKAINRSQDTALRR
jgi:hypothetical protein